MKHYHLAYIGVLIIISTASCQKGGFLDTKSTASLNREITFADSANTMDFLAGLYIDAGNYLPWTNGVANFDYSKMCDEAEGKSPALIGNFEKAVTQATFAGVFYDGISSQWALFYKDIHNINLFLQEVDKSPLSDALKVRTKAEARFLRAVYYSYLMRYFGGVPLIGDQVLSTNDEATLPRSTYEECVNYVVGELDAIAESLPLTYSGLDYGRITKGACLALKSRVLLYAASPLFNGGSVATTAELIPLTAYPTADPTRWEKARLSAKAVMDMNLYSLYMDNTTAWSGSASGAGYGFYKVFITRVNNEFIYGRPMARGKQVETQMNPRSRGGNQYLYFPLQELVDKFPTIKGRPITEDVYNAATNPTGYNPNNPYVNRDPRMAATIMYNGSKYYLNSAKGLSDVWTYKSTTAFPNTTNDGILAITASNGTTTGYYMRKMCDEYAAVTGGNTVDRCLPIIRYAEILLNYAEASNEVGNTGDAINTLKLLRQRAGITAGSDGMYGLPSSPTKEAARALIQNERAIELAFEGHRFWDIRRWKIGPLLNGKMMHGMEITKTSATTYSYKLVDVRSRYFSNIYYLWPIPKEEIQINPALLQNPGYYGAPINMNP